jgi:hypothetical protein
MREQVDPGAPADVLATTTRWSLTRRLSFRFVVLYVAIHLFPFPLYYLPGLDRLAAWLGGWRGRFVHTIGMRVFQLPSELPSVGGCGDRADHFVAVPVEAAFALAGALLWSVLDRRRPSHERLAYWATVALRYYLAHTLLRYGVIKLFKSQFLVPGPVQLLTPLGDLTPMEVLWAFMGISTAYCFFIGLAEALGALLLLFRRTALAGALISAAVLGNVFLLNILYGVCVKLLSGHLLLFTALLLAPHARRLVDAVLLGRAVPPLDSARPAYGEVAVRAFSIIKLVVVWAIVSTVLEYGYDAWHEYGDAAPRPAFYGVWDVEAFTRAGVSVDSDETWRWLAVEEDPYARLKPQKGPARPIALRADAAASVIRLRLDPKESTTIAAPFSTPEPGVLELDVPLPDGLTHVRLKRRERFRVLDSRFRWTSDLP